jgi:hypothetical protein
LLAKAGSSVFEQFIFLVGGSVLLVVEAAMEHFAGDPGSVQELDQGTNWDHASEVLSVHECMSEDLSQVFFLHLLVHLDVAFHPKEGIFLFLIAEAYLHQILIALALKGIHCIIQVYQFFCWLSSNIVLNGRYVIVLFLGSFNEVQVAEYTRHEQSLTDEARQEEEQEFDGLLDTSNSSEQCGPREVLLGDHQLTVVEA